MKEFDIENAKAGAPVHTVDDYMNVRILCFDVDNSDYPIVAALEVAEGETEVRRYTLKGECAIGCTRPLDLTTEIRHEGWMLIAPEVKYCYACIYDTQEEAKAKASSAPAHVVVAHIEWEE